MNSIGVKKENLLRCESTLLAEYHRWSIPSGGTFETYLDKALRSNSLQGENRLRVDPPKASESEPGLLTMRKACELPSQVGFQNGDKPVVSSSDTSSAAVDERRREVNPGEPEDKYTEKRVQDEGRKESSVVEREEEEEEKVPEAEFTSGEKAGVKEIIEEEKACAVELHDGSQHKENDGVNETLYESSETGRKTESFPAQLTGEREPENGETGSAVAVDFKANSGRSEIIPEEKKGLHEIENVLEVELTPEKETGQETGELFDFQEQLKNSGPLKRARKEVNSTDNTVSRIQDSIITDDVELQNKENAELLRDPEVENETENVTFFPESANEKERRIKNNAVNNPGEKNIESPREDKLSVREVQKSSDGEALRVTAVPEEGMENINIEPGKQQKKVSGVEIEKTKIFPAAEEFSHRPFIPEGERMRRPGGNAKKESRLSEIEQESSRKKIAVENRGEQREVAKKNVERIEKKENQEKNFTGISVTTGKNNSERAEEIKRSKERAVNTAGNEGRSFQSHVTMQNANSGQSERVNGALQKTPEISSKNREHSHAKTVLTPHVEQLSEIREVRGAAQTRTIEARNLQIIDQLKARMEFVKSEEGWSAKLKLYPENLGELRIEIVVKENVVTARFLTENDRVKQFLEASQIELKELLNQKGFEVKNIDVSVMLDMSDGGNMPEYRNETGNGRSSDIRKTTGSENFSEKVYSASGYESVNINGNLDFLA